MPAAPADASTGAHVLTVQLRTTRSSAGSSFDPWSVAGAGDFDGLMGTSAWPLGAAARTSQQALIVGPLLLVAVAGKSALLPFPGWLPRNGGAHAVQRHLLWRLVGSPGRVPAASREPES